MQTATPSTGTTTPMSVSPSMMMTPINYPDIQGSDDDESISIPTTLEPSMMGLGGSDNQSSPLATNILNQVPYLPSLSLDHSSQAAVSPADPNLNLGPLGSPVHMGSHVIQLTSSGNRSMMSSPIASAVQLNEPFNLSSIAHNMKQEVV